MLKFINIKNMEANIDDLVLEKQEKSYKAMPRYQSVNSGENSPSKCTRLTQEPSQSPTVRAGDSATFIKGMQKQSKDPHIHTLFFRA